MWRWSDGTTELYHYGIKGMKWGVRRTKEQLAHDRYSIQARIIRRLKKPFYSANGVLVTSISAHALDRCEEKSRPVTVEGIFDALKKPLNHDSIKTKYVQLIKSCGLLARMRKSIANIASVIRKYLKSLQTISPALVKR